MVKVLLVDTYSELYFRKVRTLLEQNKIKYSIKIDDINNRYGFLGLDKASMPSISAKVRNKYKIFVPRSSYSIAKEILNRCIKNENE